MASKLTIAGVSLLAACLLASCGFRPRGAVELPADLREIYVQAPGPITDELEVFLGAGGARLTDEREGADAIIAVQSEDYHRRVLSVDPTTGKEREFELVYTVSFAVRLDDGSVLVGPQTLKLRRDYVFDAEAVIGKGREESVLRDEMRRDAAQSIVRRMEAALGR